MKKDRYGRYELKYFLPPNQVKKLMAWSGTYVKPDDHAEIIEGIPKYNIRSVYFDTHDLGLYYEKMDGLKNRRKFRIRTYKRPDDETPVFLEIKYRFNTQVMKDRAKFSLANAKMILDDRGYLDRMNPPIHLKKPAERFVHYFNNWNLQPIVTVVYDRIPFVGRNDRQVRLTIDTNMRFIDHRNENRLFFPHKEEPVPLPGTVLELKFDKLMPEWMRELLRRFDIRQQSISKYAYCVEGAVFNKYERI